MNNTLMKIPGTATVPQDERLTITAKEAAAMLGVSMNTIYELSHREDFPSVRVGKRVLISRKRFIEWFDNQVGQL